MGKGKRHAAQLRTCAGGKDRRTDLRGCMGFGHPLSDGICVFYGKLEPPQGRGICADDASTQLHEKLLKACDTEQYVRARDRG